MELEYLTDELKHLVAWGAEPHRVVMMPTLRELVDLSACPSEAAAGCVMARYLRDSIDSLSGVYEFEGRKYPAEVLNRCLKLLFRFEGCTLSAPDRRRRVIIALKLYYQESQWRRPLGPERDLLRILSQHLLESVANLRKSA